MVYNSIAISGLPCSGKSTLLRMLESELRWEAVSVGDYLRDKHRTERPDISFEQYYRGFPPEELMELNNKLKDRGSRGQVIVDTRYVHIFPGNTLTFVTAPLGVGVTRAPRYKYPGQNLEEIRNILLQRELDELNIGRKLWRPEYDFRDRTHYHIVLDSSQMSPEEEVSTVLRSLRQSGFIY